MDVTKPDGVGEATCLLRSAKWRPPIFAALTSASVGRLSSALANIVWQYAARRDAEIRFTPALLLVLLRLLSEITNDELTLTVGRDGLTVAVSFHGDTHRALLWMPRAACSSFYLADEPLHCQLSADSIRTLRHFLRGAAAHGGSSHLKEMEWCVNCIRRRVTFCTRMASDAAALRGLFGADIRRGPEFDSPARNAVQKELAASFVTLPEFAPFAPSVRTFCSTTNLLASKMKVQILFKTTNSVAGSTTRVSAMAAVKFLTHTADSTLECSLPPQRAVVQTGQYTHNANCTAFTLHKALRIATQNHGNVTLYMSRNIAFGLCQSLDGGVEFYQCLTG